MQGPRRDVTYCAIGNVFPIFERTIIPSSERVKQDHLTLKMKALQFFEISGVTHPLTQSGIPENVLLQQHCCGNLISHYRHAFQVPCLRP
jgi:hypothetical protein